MSENATGPQIPLNGNQRGATTRHLPHATEGDTMERLFQALFYRLAVIYSRAIPKHIRRLGETAILLMAIICLSLLIYVHLVFNHRPLNCLSHLENVWPRQGILRVELFFDSPPENYGLRQSYAREYHYDYFYQSESSENFNGTTFQKSNASEKEIFTNSSIDTSHFFSRSPSISNDSQTMNEVDFQSLFDSTGNNLFDLDWLRQLLIEEQPILEYSLEYGFLRLSPSTRQRLNIEVLLLKLDLNNVTCFGSGLSRFLLDQLIGYQEILMANIKQLAEKETHKGYVRNVLTNDHYRFVSIAQNRRWGTYLVALAVMLIFTVSISMLLRYSHFQIFLFIIDLLRMIEHHVSVVFPAAPLLTVILALIGMEAIMSEFFNDTSTAFYVILIVWIADQYESICCHTPLSKRHWVRFFYLYHFAFYAYHARYNGQYSGLALTTSCCFIFHSMLYFFHHFELPTIEAQFLQILLEQNFIGQPSVATQTDTNDQEGANVT